MEPHDIRLGQHWRTRSGAVVRISADRSDGHSGWPGVDTWRWALSNGEIVNTTGSCGLRGEPHHSDLVELIGEAT